MKFFVYLAMLGLACAASPKLATKLRLKSAGSPLYANVGGTEKKIANAALKAWIIEGGRKIAYSGSDGAGGYENEGESLHLYDASNGRQRKLFSAYFAIVSVDELKTASGKTALLVKMTDGGLGASHVAVVNPRRGAVFSADGAEFMSRKSGSIEVGSFHDEDWDKLRANVQVRPFKTERYDLDELLMRPVIVNKRVK